MSECRDMILCVSIVDPAELTRDLIPVIFTFRVEDRTEGFTVATCLGCCSTRKYQINVHPREDSGQWHMNLKHRKYVTTSRWRMKIDGVQLCKVTKEDK